MSCHFWQNNTPHKWWGLGRTSVAPAAELAISGVPHRGGPRGSSRVVVGSGGRGRPVLRHSGSLCLNPDLGILAPARRELTLLVVDACNHMLECGDSLLRLVNVHAWSLILGGRAQKELRFYLAVSTWLVVDGCSLLELGGGCKIGINTNTNTKGIKNPQNKYAVSMEPFLFDSATGPHPHA